MQRGVTALRLAIRSLEYSSLSTACGQAEVCGVRVEEQLLGGGGLSAALLPDGR
jgi:hypothetical protein